MLSNKCFTGAYVLNWSHFCCIIIFWGCPIVPILHFLTISNGEGAGSNQCKKMQDWHKTDLRLTQKSLDVWISLDFHLGPPKTNFGIKKQWFRENRTLTPPPATQPCLNVFFTNCSNKGERCQRLFQKDCRIGKVSFTNSSEDYRYTIFNCVFDQMWLRKTLRCTLVSFQGGNFLSIYHTSVTWSVIIQS